jgi:Leucine-rich repeat (LRR) protein
MKRKHTAIFFAAILMFSAVLAGCGPAPPSPSRLRPDNVMLDGRLYSTAETVEIILNDKDLTNEDIEPLMHMAYLQKLELNNNQITDITVLKETPSLRNLSLAGNRIEDIGVLRNMGFIRELDLSGNQITDIRPLRGLTTLLTLDLSGNPLDEKQINELKDALTLCTVIF